jgi:hypothetical protein
MGIEKIKVAAGVADHRDQQLMPDPLPSVALGELQRFSPRCQFSARRCSIFRCCARLSARSVEKPGSSGVMAA